MMLHMDITRWSISQSDWLYFLQSKRRNSMQSAKTRPGADCGSDHEMPITKSRLKLKTVGKTTWPFRYDLNQIPYDYTVQVTNRFKGLDLIECLRNNGQRFMALSKLSFNSLWTENFQLFKLDLEKAEESKIKLPTSAGSLEKQEFQKNIYFCHIDYTKAFDCMDHNKLWKILKEMGILDHITCLLRNLYADQEATEPDMEQWTGSKLGKEYDKVVYCHLTYLTYM